MRPDGPRNTTPHRLAPPLRRKSEPLQYYVTDVNPEKTPTASQQLQWRPLPLLLPPDPYIYYPSHHPYNYEYLHGIPYPYEDSNSSSYMAQRADVPNWRAKAEHQAQSQHAPRKWLFSQSFFIYNPYTLGNQKHFLRCFVTEISIGHRCYISNIVHG